MPDKFIREIEEILKESERSGKGEVANEQEGRSKTSGLLSKFSRLGSFISISPNKVVVAGIILIILSFILYNAFNYLFVQGIAILLPIWAGLVLFVIVYGLLFVRPGFQYEKRWRGRLVDDGIPPSTWERFRRWLRG